MNAALNYTWYPLTDVFFSMGLDTTHHVLGQTLYP